MNASLTAVLRGYEETELVSVLALLSNVLGSLFVMACALAGFGLTGVVWASVGGALAPLFPTIVLLRRLGVRRPRVERSELRVLLGQGSAFLFFNLVLALQPYIDAAILVRLAPGEAMGWHAATRRMVGVLLFPATSLSFALYATLARLHREAPEREVALMRGAHRLMVLAGAPPRWGTTGRAKRTVPPRLRRRPLRGRGSQSADPRAVALAGLLQHPPGKRAARDQSGGDLERGAAAVPAGEPARRRAPDPILHQRLENGALGISVSGLISEVLMLGIAVALVPRRILGGGLARTGAQALLAGAAMAAAGFAIGEGHALLAPAASVPA